ncbi:MAG: hypothetical protein AB4352_24650 [Hormoscilla sp.]
MTASTQFLDQLISNWKREIDSLLTAGAQEFDESKRRWLSEFNHWLLVMSNSPSYGETPMTPEKIREVYSRFLEMDYLKRVGIAG